MINNDDEIRAFEENGRRMKRVDRIFRTAAAASVLDGGICVFLFALSLLCIIMSVGITEGTTSPFWGIMGAARLICGCLANCKRKEYIWISLALAAAEALILISPAEGFFMFSAPAFWTIDMRGLMILLDIAAAAGWAMAIRVYPEYEYLKGQKGFPAFNYNISGGTGTYIPMKERYKDDPPDHTIDPRAAADDMGDITELPELDGDYEIHDIRREKL